MSKVTTNVLIALKNILNYGKSLMPLIIDDTRSSNRPHSEGELLEYYVKDIFAGIIGEEEHVKDKVKQYRKHFSYLGTSNSPPDFIIRHGPAVEVKKISGTRNNTLALNSSYPKAYLYNDDPKINRGCRECEDEYGGWTKKDMIYAVGNVKDDKLHSLWLIYGECYAADRDVYERVSKKISDSLASTSGIEVPETNELSRVNKIDPLGITHLRVRGMWGIVHPGRLYEEYIQTNYMTNIYVLLPENKYDELYKPDFSKYLSNKTLQIKDISIADPNNPIKQIKAKLLIVSFL